MLLRLMRRPAWREGRIGAVNTRADAIQISAHFQSFITSLFAVLGAWCVRSWERTDWFGRPQAWRGMREAALGAFTVGGVVAVPLATALAIAGALIPGRSPLHQLGDALYVYGALWFLLVLCGAQLKRSRASDEQLR